MERSATSFKSQKSPGGLHGNDVLVTWGSNVTVPHHLLVATMRPGGLRSGQHRSLKVPNPDENKGVV